MSFPLVRCHYIVLLIKCPSLHVVHLCPSVSGEVSGKWAFLVIRDLSWDKQKLRMFSAKWASLCLKDECHPPAPAGRIAWADQHAWSELSDSVLLLFSCRSAGLFPLSVCWQLFRGTVWGVESPVSETEKCFHTWSVISHLVFLSR